MRIQRSAGFLKIAGFDCPEDPFMLVNQAIAPGLSEIIYFSL